MTHPTPSYGLLAGRVAMITGGAHNIGRAIAIRCAAEGARVVVADLAADAAEETVRHIRAAGGDAVAALCDLSTEAGTEEAFALAESRYGTVDTLVNNAYARVDARAFGPFLRLTGEVWENFNRINHGLLFHPTHRLARALAHAERPGSVVNISSHAAARAHRNHIPYDTVKGGVDSFTRAVAVDLAPWGIRVNAVRPGAVAVETSDPDPAARRFRAEQIPLGREGVPDDIASGVLYLASDLASWVTGQVFNIDGGMAAQARPPQSENGPVWTPRTIAEYEPPEEGSR
ncbi:SDR family NAD(P)-dependent oxidoreductase [Streptomyces mutabilis]|uniref:SDR family NAD(P)-dependent oxidoreductase n=1 Tax=Streptomyces mutabilis TaxID=67332 RepID=UPI001784DD13|nr:SDR family oxidoreductase [Streptomyces mutabilis]GGQ35802.1 dehydrogenase [Streptomyces mutabilis]